MQKVEATVNHTRLEDISHELKEIGINGMIVYDVDSALPSKELTGFQAGVTHRDDADPSVKIDIEVEESMVARVLAVIARHATAFPFVCLNYQGFGSCSSNLQSQVPRIITESTLPLKCPPEPAL